MKSLAIISSTLFILVSPSMADWPFWRGDLAGSGVTTETNLPTKWDKKKNVKWRVALPEAGNSSPVITGDRIFLTQPNSEAKRRGLLCLDRKSGKTLWEKSVAYEAEERTHRTNHFCSSSPATDGERVIVAYGSAGIYCYSLDGHELWRRDLGTIDHVWGYGSSPLIHENLCIHYHGPGKGSALIALDKKTGKIVWRFDEPTWKPGKRTDGFRGQSDGGIIGAFSTPIIVRDEDRYELIMSFPMAMKAFDPKTGKELWSCDGLNPLVYTSPVHHEGMLVAMGGYYGNSIGVRTGGKGNVTGKRLWQEIRHHGGIGTGVAKNGHLYIQDAGGIAYCIDFDTGVTKWKARLPGRGNSWGSFLLAGDLIYALSQTGNTTVFKASPEKFESVGLNELEERTNSSIAVADGDLFIRTHQALWRIENSNNNQE